MCDIERIYREKVNFIDQIDATLSASGAIVQQAKAEMNSINVQASQNMLELSRLL